VSCLGTWKISSSRLVNKRNDRVSREGGCFPARPLGYSRHSFYTVEAERNVIVRVLDSRMDIRQEMSK
jgi:plasmid stabilization system protein ParE